jgi:peptide/nickel transport system permease protein
MPRLIASRLAISLLTLLIVSMLVFVATELLPGDVAQAVLGQSATPDAVAALRSVMHLDQPGWWRYLTWLGGLLDGDLGRSLVNHIPVAQLIGSRLPNSLLLAAVTAAVCVPVALTLGIIAAIRRGSLYDRVAGVLMVSAVSVPEFLVATLAVLLFAVNLHWLPAISYGGSIHSPLQFFRVFALPVLTLSFVIIAQMARMTRAALISVLDSSYIEMALLKGARPVRVVLYHALPNALGPIVNAVALSLSFLLGGVIIVETIFNYPGLAKLMVDAVATRDMPLVQACAMVFCTAYLLLVTFADVCAILSNPRLRDR